MGLREAAAHPPVIPIVSCPDNPPTLRRPGRRRVVQLRDDLVAAATTVRLKEMTYFALHTQ